MRQPFLFFLLLVFTLRSKAFEFVVDGEWEEESLRDTSPLKEHQSSKFRRSVLSNEDTEELQENDIIVHSYKVESRLTSRFAHTIFSSQVVNSGQQAQSVAFNVQIPRRAFITNFTMNVNGMTYVGSVMEKTEARNLYAKARARGKAAGIVRTNTKDSEIFKTEVHVPPGSAVEFELHYQDMLQRKLGFYEHILHLQPGQLVPNLQVDVYIFEPRGIRFAEVPPTLGKSFADLTKVITYKDKVHVVFRPTEQQQRKCKECSTTAVDGIFVVTYDVERNNSAAELQVSDGHFVHFFAPDHLSPLSKNIVFVIDVSGSMWGLKMKQMVEALNTILEDLTMDDYFSIIDFNHNVRCWSEELVPGTSIQVAEAKKYIKAIKPNGGTNINEALLGAIHMLNKASKQGLIDSHSVSMIILVSDGDPTVGEIKLKKIQKNIKNYIHEDISLFSLGIGFDVDFDFLERISMENRGIARRVHATTDAMAQMRSFYSEVSSPLLRKIMIQFPEASVTEITQNRFDKFFSGSELVVAGKLLTCADSSLSAFVTASSVNMDLSSQTEADCEQLDSVLGHQPHAFAGFARQMWAYLTINQLLNDRSLAATAASKRKITQRILSLAKEHQFVTPLTAMLVESDGGHERLLADSSKDPKLGCCTGKKVQVVKTKPEINLESSPPNWVPTTSPPNKEVSGPKLEIITMVENDPHFTLHLPKAQMDVCFNIDSEPGHILNLVSDPESGIVVNGQLIAGKQKKHNKLNTYFGTITIYSRALGIRVDVGTDRITLVDGKRQHSFFWTATSVITLSRVKISIMKEDHVMVTMDNNMSFMVLLHRVWKKHPFNVDFLGIYIPTNNIYSPHVHGLIGQFAIEPEVKVYDFHEGADPHKMDATMEVNGNKLVVTRGWQKDYRQDRKHGSDVFCWFIHNNGKGFIAGHHKDYIVPQLDSFL